MNLNVNEWKEFKISNLFNCFLSKGDLKINDCEKGNIPLISSGESNNGIVGYIDEKGDGIAEIFKGEKLTVDMFCNCFYQDKDFYSVSHGRVNILEPLFLSTPQNLMFIATIINNEKYKYSYGRAVYNNQISKMIIKLPIKTNTDGTPSIDPTHKYSEEGYMPDFEFMENYIKSLHHKPLTTEIPKGITPKLNVEDWKEYKIEELFNVTGSKTTPKEELEYIGKGIYPYVTTSAANNGVEGFYNYYTEKGNVLTIESACMGYSTYQPMNFSASDHVEILKPKFKLTPLIAMFLVGIINKENYKFSYGRKCNQTKIKNMKIKLPSLENGNPDWQWIENYMKSLPFGDSLNSLL